MTLPPRLDRLAYWIAPLLLIAGVLYQRYHVVSQDQSPWVGGGFGMFSTVDVPGARLLRAYALTDRGPALILESDPGVDPRLVYSLPTTDHLAQAASGLASQEWVVYGPEAYGDLLPYLSSLAQQFLSAQGVGGDEGDVDRKGLPSRIALPRHRAPRAVDGLGVAVQGIQVEVWRPHFDRETGRLLPALIRSARADRMVLPS